MQDTDEIQDNLLQRIFGEGCVVQRFGDINQAIFRGVGEDRAQESFPSSGYIELPDSRRFGQAIASLVSPLTAIRPQTLAGNAEVSKRSHTIFLFDANTITRVLPAFGGLLAEEYPDGLPDGFVAKAVGFRKSKQDQEGKDQLPYNIGDYWHRFQPDCVSQSARPDSLVDFVRKARYIREKIGECGEACNVLVDGIVELLCMQDAKDDNGRGFTKTRLMEAWAERGEADRLWFKALLSEWCLQRQDLTRECWRQTSEVLLGLLKPWIGNDLTNESKMFMEWTEEVMLPEEETWQPSGHLQNVYHYESSVGPVDIELATIHAVKGETHTATLVLETYWYGHDLKEMMQFLVGTGDQDLLQKSRTCERMKRIFVGATRPRELLCFAVHKDHLDVQQAQALRDRGWEVRDLTLGYNAV